MGNDEVRIKFSKYRVPPKNLSFTICFYLNAWEKAMVNDIPSEEHLNKNRRGTGSYLLLELFILVQIF
jgi:hypothetical protein